MGELVLNNELRLEAGPSELFTLFGQGDPALGWLFGSEAPLLRPGSLVRLALPLGGLARSPGTARVLSCQPNRRIDLMHETPWAGRVVCRFDPTDSGGTRLRVRITIDDGEVARLGAELGLLDSYAARKLGMRSTGNARRGVGGPPSVGTTNLWLEPGDTSLDEVLATTVGEVPAS